MLKILAHRQITEPAIGGFVPLSTSDYPGHTAAVIFIAGCPWRCGYCHNPELLPREYTDFTWDKIESWLKKHRNERDAVVISGGEPLSEPLLPAMLERIRELGFATAIHTTGAYPERLKACLPYLDWVGFDIKTLFARYEEVTQRPKSGGIAEKSLDILCASPVAFECRTTVHPDLVDDATLLILAQALHRKGVSRYALQCFLARECYDETLKQSSISAYPAPETLARLGCLFSHFVCRRD